MNRKITRVCAIDAGTRNFAWCIVDKDRWREPAIWRREDLWAPAPGRRRKPTKNDLVEIAVGWYKRNRPLLRTCDLIVLENQIREQFIVLNTALHALMHPQVQVVHPMSVGSFWGLPKTRELKKPAGVQVCRANGVALVEGEKADDLADTWLMAVHAFAARGLIEVDQLCFFQGAPSKQ